jgi:hypothetical protein
MCACISQRACAYNTVYVGCHRLRERHHRLVSTCQYKLKRLTARPRHAVNRNGQDGDRPASHAHHGYYSTQHFLQNRKDGHDDKAFHFSE